MEQSINLLPEKYNKPKVPFGASQIIKFVSISLCIIIMILFIQFWQLESNKLKKTDKENVLAQVETDIENFLNEFNKPEINQFLVEEIENIKVLLNNKKALTKQVEGLVVNKRPGFSPYLTSLARRHITGVWLTEIRMIPSSNLMILAGETIDAPAITNYLEALQLEKPFKGRNFDNISMERIIRESENLVKFKIEVGELDNQQIDTT